MNIVLSVPEVEIGHASSGQYSGMINEDVHYVDMNNNLIIAVAENSNYVYIYNGTKMFRLTATPYPY